MHERKVAGSRQVRRRSNSVSWRRSHALSRCRQCKNTNPLQKLTLFTSLQFRDANAARAYHCALARFPSPMDDVI